MGKAFIGSKTMWVNILTIILYVLNNHYGWIGIPQDIVLLAVAFINIVLRFLTGQPIKRAI